MSSAGPLTHLSHGLRLIADVHRRRLVLENDGLIRKVASAFFGYGFDLNDMMQDGYVGMLLAVQSYSRRRGAFSTHAFWCIRWQLRNHQQRELRARGVLIGGVFVPHERIDALATWSDDMTMHDVIPAREESALEEMQRLEEHHIAQKALREAARKMSVNVERVIERGEFGKGWRNKKRARLLAEVRAAL